MTVENIKTFLNEYIMYNINEIHKLDKVNDAEEITLLWGRIDGLKGTQSYIEAMEKEQ